jgi:hypothetical protein
MRGRLSVAALLALALGAATPLYAQQQPAPPPDEAPFPERVIEGIGGAVRGFFNSIFGAGREREGAIPQAPPPPNSPEASPAPASEPPPRVFATQNLQSAIAKGDYATAVKMIEQGADVEAKDPGAGASALHYAVMKGEMPLVSLLLQRGADVNSRTKSGTTPLHTAVLYKHTEIAEYLIEKGADINARSASGATPLGLAIAANYNTVEQMLRRRGGQ